MNDPQPEGHMASHIERRKFLATLGGAAAWPLAARAQQAAKLPIIGFLASTSASHQSQWVAAFGQRLRELGWIDGRTARIEVRWAEGRPERFAEIAVEFRHGGRRGARGKASDIGYPNRVRRGERPARHGPGRKFGTAGRQRDRPVGPGL